MKLKEGYVTHESDGEHIMVGTGGTGFAGLVRSNRTAAYIVECLKKDVTEDQIVDAMAEKYDAPRQVIQKDVKRILEELRSIGAIDDQHI